MQTSHLSFKKSIWLLPLAIAAFSLVIILSWSCGKKAKSPTCVKLTKAQIQKWVNKGYTDSTKPNYMASMQFKTAYAFPGSVFRVFVIGARKDGSLINESLTELTPVDTCNKSHIKLSTYIFTGLNPADFYQLKILKSNGKIIDSLKYLQLEPFTFTDPTTHFDILAYNNSVVKEGGIILKYTAKGDQVLPCPPCAYCKDPCPPPTGCVAPCNPIKIDTSGTQ